MGGGASEPDDIVRPLPDYRSAPAIPTQADPVTDDTPPASHLLFRRARLVRTELDGCLKTATAKACVRFDSNAFTLAAVAGHYQRAGYIVTRETHYDTDYFPGGGESISSEEYICVAPDFKV